MTQTKHKLEVEINEMHIALYYARRLLCTLPRKRNLKMSNVKPSPAWAQKLVKALQYQAPVWDLDEFSDREQLVEWLASRLGPVIETAWEAVKHDGYPDTLDALRAALEQMEKL